MPHEPATGRARTVRPSRTSLDASLTSGIGAISHSRWVYYEALDWFDPPAELIGRIEALIDAIETCVEEAQAIWRALDPEEAS